METFACQRPFITLHPPLEKLATRPGDAPIERLLLYSDLQERGSEMIGIAKSNGARWAGSVVLSFAIFVWSGCGGGMNVGGSGSDSTANGMTVTPPTAMVRAGDSTQFAAMVTGNANQTVTWSVNGIAGGNATVGTIDATGKYKAPSALPSPNSVKVKAVSTADKSLSATSSVSLQNPIPVPWTISPNFFVVGNFSFTIGGSNFVNGSTVIFGGTPLSDHICVRHPD